MLIMDACRGLALNGALKIVDDEVNLDARAQSPIRKPSEALTVGVVTTQFMENPVFESFPIQF